MRYCLFLLFFILGAFRALSQSSSTHDISVKISPYGNCTIYLGAYYGKGQLLADSAHLNENGEGHFHGSNQLTDGLYFITSPDKKVLFEFLMTDGQHFNIIADISRLNDVEYIGSPDNVLFKTYVKGASAISTENNSLLNQYKAAKSHRDSLIIRNKLNNLNSKLIYFKDSIIHSSPKSLTALFLTAGKQAELPPNTILKTKKDTLNAISYVRKHFWQDVPFNDDRLLYTPFFETKIDSYYNLYVSPVADSVIHELQYMLLYARTGKQMYPYLLMKFTNQYFNPQHVGQNKVFLYLFNNFYMKGDTSLLSAGSKKLIFDRAYQLMANQVGDAAPPLEMTGLDEKATLLYNIKAPYTMVVFWEPSCVHCQKELPRIDSIYKAKWKKAGIKIYAVNVNTDLEKEVPKFIKEKNLSTDWIFTYQTAGAAKAIAANGSLNYFQLYDVYDTPSIYLLDAQKHIIAKHLSIEQFDRLLNLKANSTNK